MADYNPSHLDMPEMQWLLIESKLLNMGLFDLVECLRFKVKFGFFFEHVWAD